MGVPFGASPPPIGPGLPWNPGGATPHHPIGRGRLGSDPPRRRPALLGRPLRGSPRRSAPEVGPNASVVRACQWVRARRPRGCLARGRGPGRGPATLVVDRPRPCLASRRVCRARDRGVDRVRTKDWVSRGLPSPPAPLRARERGACPLDDRAWLKRIPRESAGGRRRRWGCSEGERCRTARGSPGGSAALLPTACDADRRLARDFGAVFVRVGPGPACDSETAGVGLRPTGAASGAPADRLGRPPELRPPRWGVRAGGGDSYGRDRVSTSVGWAAVHLAVAVRSAPLRRGSEREPRGLRPLDRLGHYGARLGSAGEIDLGVAAVVVGVGDGEGAARSGDRD